MKVASRQQLRAARKSLPERVREEAHRRMASHLRCILDGLPQQGVIALYAGTSDEADPRGLLDVMSPGKVAWPRVTGDDLELVVCDEVDLVPGFRGILEPPEQLPPVALSQVRMLVVPGLAFDRQGHRLGQGGGFYDRLLERVRATAHPGLVVGLAYALQIVHDVPREAHDQPVDLVLTEDGLVGE